jgi:Mor family transcriptional regulator
MTTQPAHQSTAKSMRDAPEMLMDLYDHTSAAARAAGLSADDADKLALDVVDQLGEIWAGQQLYFGKGCIMRLRKRDLDIYNEFTGKNHAELAAKYKVSTVWIYAVIRKVKQQIHDEAQQSLL